MLDKEKFMECLKAIVEVAASQNNILSKEEIDNYFGNMELSREQYDLVYEYLSSNNITVKHYIKNDDTQDAEIINEDEEYVSLYLSNLESIEELGKEEENRLIKELISGNNDAKKRIVEGYLKYVVEIAREFFGNGVLAGDLIQEGNVGLLEAVEHIISKDKNEKGDNNLHELIKKHITLALKKAIDEKNSDKGMKELLLKKADRLSEASKQLAEEFGREATIEELAEHMKTDIEEVKDIMRLSLEALGVEHLH